MPQFAMITGDGTYTPGDGAPIVIPRVRVEVALEPDSASAELGRRRRCARRDGHAAYPV